MKTIEINPLILNNISNWDKGNIDLEKKHNTVQSEMKSNRFIWLFDVKEAELCK